MRDFMTIAKALADEKRVRILLALRGGELCVCQLVELLGLAPSTVSKHAAVLYNARLVEARKSGRWMYYLLAGTDAPPAARQAIAWVCGALSDNARAKTDCCKVEQIVQSSKEALCRRPAEK